MNKEEILRQLDELQNKLHFNLDEGYKYEEREEKLSNIANEIEANELEIANILGRLEDETNYYDDTPLSEINEKIADIYAECKELGEQLDSLKTKYTEGQAKIDGYKANVFTRMKQIDGLREDIAHSEVAIRRARINNKVNREEIELAANNSINEDRERIEVLDGEVATINEQISNAENDNNNLQNEIQRVQEDLNRAERNKERNLSYREHVIEGRVDSKKKKADQKTLDTLYAANNALKNQQQLLTYNFATELDNITSLFKNGDISFEDFNKALSELKDRLPKDYLEERETQIRANEAAQDELTAKIRDLREKLNDNRNYAKSNEQLEIEAKKMAAYRSSLAMYQADLAAVRKENEDAASLVEKLENGVKANTREVQDLDLQIAISKRINPSIVDELENKKQEVSNEIEEMKREIEENKILIVENKNVIPSLEEKEKRAREAVEKLDKRYNSESIDATKKRVDEMNLQRSMASLEALKTSHIDIVEIINNVLNQQLIESKQDSFDKTIDPIKEEPVEEQTNNNSTTGYTKEEQDALKDLFNNLGYKTNKDDSSVNEGLIDSNGSINKLLDRSFNYGDAHDPLSSTFQPPAVIETKEQKDKKIQGMFEKLGLVTNRTIEPEEPTIKYSDEELKYLTEKNLLELKKEEYKQLKEQLREAKKDARQEAKQEKKVAKVQAKIEKIKVKNYSANNSNQLKEKAKEKKLATKLKRFIAIVLGLAAVMALIVVKNPKLRAAVSNLLAQTQEDDGKLDKISNMTEEDIVKMAEENVSLEEENKEAVEEIQSVTPEVVEEVATEEVIQTKATVEEKAKIIIRGGVYPTGWANRFAMLQDEGYTEEECNRIKDIVNEYFSNKRAIEAAKQAATQNNQDVGQVNIINGEVVASPSYNAGDVVYTTPTNIVGDPDIHIETIIDDVPEYEEPGEFIEDGSKPSDNTSNSGDTSNGDDKSEDTETGKIDDGFVELPPGENGLKNGDTGNTDGVFVETNGRDYLTDTAVLKDGETLYHKSGDKQYSTAGEGKDSMLENPDAVAVTVDPDGNKVVVTVEEGQNLTDPQKDKFVDDAKEITSQSGMSIEEMIKSLQGLKSNITDNNLTDSGKTK